MADYTLHGRQLNVGDKVWDCFNQKWLMVMRLDDTCGIYFCEPMSPEKIAVMYAKDSRTQRERNLAWDIPPAIKARLRQSQPKGTTGGYLLNDAADHIESLEHQLAEASKDAARLNFILQNFESNWSEEDNGWYSWFYNNRGDLSGESKSRPDIITCIDQAMKESQ